MKHRRKIESVILVVLVASIILAMVAAGRFYLAAAWLAGGL